MLGKKKGRERRRRMFSLWKNEYVNASPGSPLEEKLTEGLVHLIEKERDPATRKMRAAELVNVFRQKDKFFLMVSIARFASMEKQGAVMHALISKAPSPETDAAIQQGLETLKISPSTRRGAERVLAKHAESRKKEHDNSNATSPPRTPTVLKVAAPSSMKERPLSTPAARHWNAVEKVFEKGFLSKKWDSFLESAERFFRGKRDPLTTPFREDVKSFKEVFQKDFFSKFLKERWKQFIQFLTRTPGQ